MSCKSDVEWPVHNTYICMYYRLLFYNEINESVMNILLSFCFTVFRGISISTANGVLGVF